MALLTCPECGKKVSEYASVCHECGCPVSVIKSKQTSVPSPGQVNEWNALAKKCYDAKDYANAVKYWQQSLEQGDAVAQFNLGCCYYMGRGVSKDRVKSKELLTLSAKQGNKDAQEVLALLSF